MTRHFYKCFACLDVFAVDCETKRNGYQGRVFNTYPAINTETCDCGGKVSGVEVRVRPIGGGGNLILCMSCWARENRYCYERGRETGAPKNWPQQDFYKAEVYATRDEEAA